MTSTKKRITATLTAAILSTTLAIPATAAEAPPIRVSSYKGSTLEIGERSGLIIGPSGTEYTVTSSNPDSVAVDTDRKYNSRKQLRYCIAENKELNPFISPKAFYTALLISQ